MKTEDKCSREGLKIERGKRREQKRREVTWRDAEEEEEDEEERPENGGDCKETDDMETENERETILLECNGVDRKWLFIYFRTY